MWPESRGLGHDPGKRLERQVWEPGLTLPSQLLHACEPRLGRAASRGPSSQSLEDRVTVRRAQDPRCLPTADGPRAKLALRANSPLTAFQVSAPPALLQPCRSAPSPPAQGPRTASRPQAAPRGHAVTAARGGSAATCPRPPGASTEAGPCSGLSLAGGLRTAGLCSPSHPVCSRLSPVCPH